MANMRRNNIQELVDSLDRADSLEGKHDFREARQEIANALRILKDEDNRLRLKQEGRWA